MAKFIITAQACKFEQCNGYVAKTYMLFQKPLLAVAAECKTVAELAAHMQTLATKVRAGFNGSFFVSQRLEKGSRAPAGYRQRQPREIDCQAPPPPKVGDHSPWGTIDHIEALGPHAVMASTPSHGGIWVNAELLELIPEPFRKTGFSGAGWFEEDCDWAIPYLWCGLAEFERGKDHLTAAEATLQRWNPDAWAAWSASVREAVSA